MQFAPGTHLQPADSLRRADRIFFGGELADVRAIAYDERHCVLSVNGLTLRLDPTRPVDVVGRDEEVF